jgi:hypothetical protein
MKQTQCTFRLLKILLNLAVMATFTINFAPIEISGNSQVLAGYQPYDSDRLDSLRKEHRSTHIFRRDGPASIIDIPIAAGNVPIGSQQQEIDLSQQKKLWPALLSAALVRAFSGLRDIYSEQPVSVVGSANRGFILHPSLPTWIQRRTLVRFDTRTHYNRDRASVGIVCEASIKNLILNPCSELMALGISPIGRYVQTEEPNFNPQLMNKRRLVGRVKDIQGDTLLLDDHADGISRLKTDQAFLEARREIVDDCVKHILGNDALIVLAKAVNLASIFHSGPGRIEQIEEALRFLRDKVSLEVVPGVALQIGQLLTSKNSQFPATETIPKPTLVFDPSGTRKDDWNERGIKKNGPFDRQTFSPKKLRIAVVCQAKYEGQTDRFVAKFFDGMPNVLTGQNKQARYGDGFLRRFALDKPVIDFFIAQGSSADAYTQASHAALTKSADEAFKWDLALIQIEEEFKEYNDSQNPYFATKSVFLKRDVPVQSVRLETMSQSDNQLVFSMNHMSLATYAKLGGTPWLLASQQTVAHELVIGLGSHSVANSRLGTQQRYVGITTVFSSDGSYLLSDRTAVVPFDDYADALYETLRRSIVTVRKQNNWRSTDKVRLVFHMFKPPKDTEAEAIKKTVEGLELENVTFAFLHIAPSHPYLIFDSAQKGFGYGELKKGVLGPTRGLHLKLGNNESLVVFSGASELKQASDGMPRPCLLKLHRLSTFTDMTYLARQAFEFSGHSWRMLSPEPFPITIRYSDLIADRLAGLNTVEGWDSEAIRFGQIGRTLWFL